MKTLRFREQGDGDTRRLQSDNQTYRHSGLFPTEVLASSGSTGFISALSDNSEGAPRQVEIILIH